MEPKIEQLNSNQHKNIKLVVNQDFSHVANHHVAPVIAQEIPSLSSDLPVAFIKNSSTGQYLCVAILGFKEEENLLVKDGKWTGPLVPAGYTHHPLSLIPLPEDKKQYTLTIDLASKAITDEGEALFTENGEPTEYLEKRRKSLETYYAYAMATDDFTKTLVEMELLEEKQFSFQVGEDKRSVNGLFVINEDKFNQLSDEKFIELRKKGYLAPMYAHMLSLAQIPRLVKRISEK
ncbi:SapC family protein [Aliikangiella marina]|uniref:SapC family protein n=1 Tax=Aliikangiella marina TaxID=1712262 RepID=A0A545TBM8_9GAMM|nr:SapC family protein [Aliikangiella marina]TQV74615.1 SapC family protein [Aliikangiella marina]